MVKIVENMPHAVLKGLYPTIFQIMVVFAMTGFFLVFLKVRKVIYLYGVVLTSCLFVCSIGWDSYLQLSRVEIIFFNISGTRALALTDGRETTILYDKCEKAQVKLGYYMKPYFGARGINNIEMFQLSDSLQVKKHNLRIAGDFIIFKGVRLFIEPLFERRNLRIDPSPISDVVWVRNQGKAKTADRSFLQSRFTLFRTSDNSGEDMAQSRGKDWIEINRAVQMIIHPVSNGSGEKNVCRYFD